VLRAPPGGGEDKGDPLVRRTEEVGVGGHGGDGSRSGGATRVGTCLRGVRTGETEGGGGDRWGPGPQCPGLNPNQTGQSDSKF
jgi:hypothetical protein